MTFPKMHPNRIQWSTNIKIAHVNLEVKNNQTSNKIQGGRESWNKCYRYQRGNKKETKFNAKQQNGYKILKNNNKMSIIYINHNWLNEVNK